MKPSGLHLGVDRDADMPLGAQLAAALRDAIGSGSLAPGDRLPSVRDLAAEAGVNVNTVRAVYGKLEHEGLVSSEHGRGTFVAAGARSDPASRRGELRRQIAGLEAELSRHPDQVKRSATVGGSSTPAVLTSAELARVRDELLDRLEQLDAARTDVVRQIEMLDREEAMEELRPEPSEARSTSSSLGPVRVRWVGGA